MHRDKVYSKYKRGHLLLIQQKTSLVLAFILQLTTTIYQVLEQYQRRISTVSKKVIKILFPFPTIYLCEARFPSYNSTNKIKQNPKSTKYYKRSMQKHLVNNEKQISSKQCLRTFRMTDDDILIRETSLFQEASANLLRLREQSFMAWSREIRAE